MSGKEKRDKKGRITINQDPDFQYANKKYKPLAIVCWVLGILVVVALPVALLLYYYL